MSRELFFSMYQTYNPEKLNPYDWCSLYIDTKTNIYSPKSPGPKQTPKEKPV